MTIDEAIEHAKRMALMCKDSKCAADKQQLVEWLRKARGAEKAALWYTAKIRELENRSKVLETLISEKEFDNAKLRELVGELWGGYNDPRCEECHLKDTPTCADCPICAREAAVIDRMRELGIEVEHA